MNIFESISMGISQLMANKLRSILSLIGILIAVGAVTGIVSIGEGLQHSIMEEFDKIGGQRLIWTYAPDPWYRNDSGAWVRRTWEEHITNFDLAAIRQASEKIDYVVPYVGVPSSSGEFNISYRDVSTYTQLIGSSPEYPKGANWEIGSGRFINETDIKNGSKVCVLGSKSAEQLMGPGVSAVGREVDIDGIRYTVVGVMAPKEFFDNNYDTRTILPFTTVQIREQGNNYIGSIEIRAKGPEDIPAVTNAIRAVYNRLHTHGDEIPIENAEDQLAEFNQVMFIMKMIAGGIAAISLVVGAIGIMNIMLVSVTERTREIGVRMAIGATRSNILAQFIVEAVVLCLFGGILGIGLGLLFGKSIAVYISSAANTTFVSVIPPQLMFGSVLFSMLIGLVSGVYPAWRASQLDPVEALRDE